MNNNKPRILICSESSKVSSGFGVYNKHLLTGLYETKKYDIAEFASYGLIGDKEQHNIPWKYYPNAIDKNDSRVEIFNQTQENHFGKWRFDRVLLDFKPDIVIDVRDYWMSAYQGKSPLRKYFHWILMPTVDSAPQQEEWLDTYLNADAIFSYSHWGRDVLLQQTSNKINFIDVASPCADLETYKIDHVTVQNNTKVALGLDPNTVIIGSVMRNQKRKLIPELIQTFEKIVEHAYVIDAPYKNSVILYLHTSYPDAGWDIPNLIKNSKFSNRIYFTYLCKKCSRICSSNFSGASKICEACGNKSMMIPNVSNGIDSGALSKIMNIFDVYIQYSICEGFGMPQIEAAACGVPVLTINYSAMIDVINNVGAEPIDIGTYFKELETTAIRTYPNHDSCIKKVEEILLMPQQLRKRKGFDSSSLVQQNYSWKHTIDKWIKYIDSVDHTKYQRLWNSAIPDIVQLIDINKTPLRDSIYLSILSLKDTHLKKINLDMDSYWLLKQIQAAQDGLLFNGPDARSFSVIDLINMLNTIIQNHNTAELARVQTQSLTSEDYIDYANK